MTETTDPEVEDYLKVHREQWKHDQTMARLSADQTMAEIERDLKKQRLATAEAIKLAKIESRTKQRTDSNWLFYHRGMPIVASGIVLVLGPLIGFMWYHSDHGRDQRDRDLQFYRSQCLAKQWDWRPGWEKCERP